MNPLILILAQEGLKLAAGQIGGKAGSALDTASALTGIVQIALAAYEKETGEPMDLTKIKPFEPIE